MISVNTWCALASNTMNYVQLMSNGCSRWSRYMNTGAADTKRDDDDDDECLTASAYHATQTASDTDRFCRQEAAPKYMRSALFVCIL